MYKCWEVHLIRFLVKERRAMAKNNLHDVMRQVPRKWVEGLYFRLRWFVIHGDVTDESKETIMHEATAGPQAKDEQSKTTIELR